MLQFEDIVWDEFCQSDDHIVPHPIGEKISEHSLLVDSHKKPCRDAVGLSDKVEDRSANKSFCWEDEEDKISVVNNKRKTMLEKASWLQTPDDVFPSSCESDFVKDSGDFLYYGWPDIGSLEDVDRIFRNCDFSFGPGANNEEELGWFSSADAVEGSGDALNGGCGMMNVHRKQQRQQCQSDGERSDGTSFYYSNNSLQNEGSTLPSEATSHKAVSSIGVQQQKQATGHKPFSYLQSDMQFINSDYIHPSDQTTVYPALSAIKTENNGFTSVSPKESFSSDQVLSADSSHGPSFQVTPIVPNEKRESIHHQQVFLSPYGSKPENMDMGVQVPLCDSVSMEKSAQHLGNKFETRNDTEGVPGEVGSSALQESSSVLDEISLEAASFRQLQLVMEQLDLRTKLCIRDSLYRLARSAEQRHNHANLNGSCCGDDRDSSGVLVSEGANKCSGFLDMERDTNTIDRSMAHLLLEWAETDPQIHMPIGFGLI